MPKVATYRTKLFIICVITLIMGVAAFRSDEQSKSLRIPLKQAGRLFLIEATVDGQQGNFVFDTGATNLVLNKTYFRSYSRNRNPTAGISGTGGVSGQTRIGSFQINGWQLDHQQADVADLGQIENQRQVRILGLIGMDVFQHFEIHMDLRSQNLELWRLDKNGNCLENPPASEEPDLVCPIVFRNGIMFIEGVVSGQSLDLCLDTGAESNVICSSCRENILASVKINRRTTLTGVGGKSAEVLFGAMTDFTLANKKFAPMQTIVTSLAALSAAYDFPVDGVLGYDFFVRGKIRINLVKKELAIKFYE